MKDFSIGIDIGGTKIAYGLFDRENRIVGRRRTKTPQDLEPEEFFGQVKREIVDMVGECGVSLADVEGIGIGMPGSISHPDGVIVISSNIPKLAGFAAKAYLCELFDGLRIELDNDAHAAAIGESRFGAGKGFDNMLYCAVSSGISSAMIIDGKLFKGSNGFAGESGHMLITPDETPEVFCPCGNDGCLMSWCSGQMIAKHVAKWIGEGKETQMATLADCGEISTLEIAQAWRNGDSLAAQAVKQMQHYLAVWLFNIYVFVNIDCIVLGGGLLKLGDDFWNGVFEEFEGYKKSGCKVNFKEAELGDDMGLIGARELLY